MCNPEIEKNESESNASEEAIAAAINDEMSKADSLQEEANLEEDSIPEEDSIKLAKIARKLPKYGDSLLITNLLKLFREFTANPNETENRVKVEQFIDDQIDRLSNVIEEYSKTAVPDDAGEIHQKVLDSLSINYEALYNFKDLFINMDIDNLKHGFILLIEADNSLAEIESYLRKQVNEMVITTIL